MVELFFGETLELIVVYSLENIHLKSGGQGEQLCVVVYFIFKLFQTWWNVVLRTISITTSEVK